MEYRLIDTQKAWDQIVRTHNGHPMQSWGWGSLKEQTGSWTAHHVVCEDAGSFVCAALVLVRKLPWPFKSICYSPRGPIVEDAVDLPRAADLIAQWCREHVHAVSLKIDPGVSGVTLNDGWKQGSTILIANTAVIDTVPDEDAILKSFHSKKARQYIRKAGRMGVEVRRASREDLPAILDLYHKTAEEDNFFIHDDHYYQVAFDAMDDVNQVFVAECEGRLLAFLWNVTTPAAAFELWGGVNEEGKTKRANYLLKWTAILEAKQSGAVLYDLNGLLNDGISKFKMLFIEEPTQWIGTFDKPLSPLFSVWEGSLRLYRRLFK